MKRNKVEKWCSQEGWTEPRKLDNDIWVAFPPGGAIETPLPEQAYIHLKWFSLIETILGGMLLLLSMMVVGVMAVCISPCFLFSSAKTRYSDRS